MKRAHGLIIVLSMTLLAGCAYQTKHRHAELDLRKRGVLAVVPFQNLAGQPNAGLIAAELFQSELHSRLGNDVDLVLPETVAERLAGLEGQALPPQEVGELLDAQLLLIGRVTEYDYKHGLGETPAVGISARLLEARSGSVLWSGARSQTGRYSWIKQDSLSRLAQVICAHLAKDMVGD